MSYDEAEKSSLLQLSLSFLSLIYAYDKAILPNIFFLKQLKFI